MESFNFMKDIKSKDLQSCNAPMYISHPKERERERSEGSSSNNNS